MIKLSPMVYRTLWIGCLLPGAFLLAPVLVMGFLAMSGSLVYMDSRTLPVLALLALLGVVLLRLAVHRLRRPLKAAQATPSINA